MIRNVVSIDIGLLHLGLSVFEVDDLYRLVKVVGVDLINLTEFRHQTVSEEACELYHTRTISDWVDHFLQEHAALFSVADFILIERQPHGPFVAVEQLLFSKFRRRAIFLLSPRSVHAYLCIGQFDYEGRKRMSCAIAERVLPAPLVERLATYPRAHDIADSICQFLYWRNREEKVERERQRHERIQRVIHDRTIDCMTWLEAFRYHR